MTQSKKIAYRLAWAGGFLLLLLALFFLSAPRIVNLEAVKGRAVGRFAEETGGQLAYQNAKLSFFPRPHLILSSLNFAIPDRLSGSVERLTFYPKLLPLLRGEIRIKRFRAIKPDLVVSAVNLPSSGPQDTFDPATVIGAAAAGVAAIDPHLEGAVEDGRLAVALKPGDAMGAGKRRGQWRCNS